MNILPRLQPEWSLPDNSWADFVVAQSFNILTSFWEAQKKSVHRNESTLVMKNSMNLT